MGAPERLSTISTAFPLALPEHRDPKEIARLCHDIETGLDLRKEEVTGGYLTVRGGGTALGARIKQIIFQQPGAVFCFRLKENSANGVVTGKIDNEDARSYFVANGLLQGGLSLQVVGISFALRHNEIPREKSPWRVNLELGTGEDDIHCRSFALNGGFEVRGGYSVNPLKEEDGLLILQKGKLNPALLAPEARQLFKDYLF